MHRLALILISALAAAAPTAVPCSMAALIRAWAVTSPARKSPGEPMASNSSLRAGMSLRSSRLLMVTVMALVGHSRSQTE